ncbi:hypothetical protein HYH02_012829 [Chlamydomonas schloesseri]|uniref:Alpha-1,3-glucosyltransferase n=1 Tax=Chlamydomonas schloesseri TaxID=2026947 RepID=A0A835SZU2_9CHLO|nr:hypothetical protein HYH02_012829 [Chlamydomonas schloesseri]|eukprot:KAG2433128.1 hypothetical protein HYH02_012829 [Chlamydomonas schloesseri]
MTSILEFLGDDPTSTALLVLLAVLARVLTGLSGYSGAGDPPKYGDYEAQRHWMELTVNLPVREWYVDSAVNNASYWPLDYPPLSGYQSWLCGVALRAAEPAAVALVSSHGYETSSSKTLMRWTVIVADLLIYIPACLVAVAVFYPRPGAPAGAAGLSGAASSPSSSPTNTPASTAAAAAAAGPSTSAGAPSFSHSPSFPRSPSSAASSSASAAAARRGRLLALFGLLFNPALLLIDHGHFQYNGISLGLTLAAVAAIARGRRLLGSVLYVAALNHKHMALFFAPAFFAHLLGWALHDPAHKGAAAKMVAVAKLGVTVIAAFAVCWAPWLHSKEAVLQVLSRIFPVRRGLYEDYVANWWCATSALIKWKSRFPAPLLLRAAAAATLAAAAPAMAHQIAGRRGGGAGPAEGAVGGANGGGGGAGPTRWGLVRCLVNSGFAFYMFSYQVHEKSILMPLLPLTLAAGREPTLAAWLPLLGCFSMFPLLVRDGVGLPYVAVAAMYGAVMAGAALQQARQLQAERRAAPRSGAVARALDAVTGFLLDLWPLLAAAGVAAAAALHAARLLLPAPPHLPWLYDRAFITFSFVGFATAFAYSQLAQWLEEPAGAPVAAQRQRGGQRLKGE